MTSNKSHSRQKLTRRAPAQLSAPTFALLFHGVDARTGGVTQKIHNLEVGKIPNGTLERGVEMFSVNVVNVTR